jgi:hypothetical protein
VGVQEILFIIWVVVRTPAGLVVSGFIVCCLLRSICIRTHYGHLVEGRAIPPRCSEAPARRGRDMLACAVVAGSAVVSTKRIALVTGANKGIGKEVARLLGALPDHAVVLGCRDEQLGMAAA